MGFYQAVGHPGSGAAGGVGGGGMARQADHGQIDAALAQQAGGVQPIELRHFHIHQDQVVAVAAGGRAFQRIEGLQAVIHQGHAMPHIVQNFTEQCLVDRGIFRQQDVRRRFADALQGVIECRRCHVHLGGYGPERNLKPENAALTLNATDAHFAMHRLDQLLRNRQTKAGATEPAGNRAVGLAEALEQMRQLVGGNADAAIFHLEAQAVELGVRRQQPAAQGDLASRGELQRVARRG